MSKIKLNENHKAEWKFVNCEEFNPYEGKVIVYRFSDKYGYRFTILNHNETIYITQALYNPSLNEESISVHPVHSINDAKAVLEVMIQFIKGMREKLPDAEA